MSAFTLKSLDLALRPSDKDLVVEVILTAAHPFFLTNKFFASQLAKAADP